MKSITGGKKFLRKLEIKIGTRGSLLALAQTKIIENEILRAFPQAKIITVPIKTSGDKNMAPFSSDPSGIKGMFTFEIERALLNGEIDLAVHSLKDLPANINKSLPLIAYSKRAKPFDALIMRDEKSNVIGTSSLRRKLQLENLYPEKKIIPVRGNINTRLNKLDKGENSLGGLVMAYAGLKRLGLEKRITKIFNTDEIMPAPGQGILACQGREDENYFYMENVNDKNSEDCARAERSFAKTLNAGCNVPVGAYSEIFNDEIILKGLYIEDKKFFRGVIKGNRKDAEILGEKLAKEIFN